MTEFAEKAKKTPQDLNFTAKRAIILAAVEKIVGTKQPLQVTGHIPLNQNVSFQTSHRNHRTPQCWQVDLIQRPH